LDSLENTEAEFFAAVFLGRDAPVAARPIARWQVEQDRTQVVAGEGIVDVLDLFVVREKELDAGESGLGRTVESFEERVFPEQHGEVGRKFGHPWNPFHGGDG
jgi:hypothetical protein